MLVAPEKIAQVLGGTRKLGRKIETSSDLESVVAKGLPSSLVTEVVEKIYPHQPEKTYDLVPRTTLNRKLQTKKLLSLEESQKLERLARVYALALEVWGNPTEAREFLTRSHPMLKDRIPFEASLTELGARQVEEILGRIMFGSAA